MAITNAQETEILKVVAGLFDAAPGGTNLTELANLVEGGMTTSQLADALAANTLFTNGIMAGKVTVDDQVAVLMDHFGVVADSDPASAGSQAEAYFTAQIESGVGFGQIIYDAVTFLSQDPATLPAEFADTAALLANKALVAELYSRDHSSSDLAQLQSILAGVSASTPTTEAEAAEYLNSIGEGPNAGESLALTFGADTFTGGAGNDSFTAGVVNNGAGTLVNSLEDADIINGSGGDDTLNVVLNAATITTPSITDVEIINIRNIDNDATVDFTDTSGTEQIWNNASSSSRTLTYDAAPIAATFGIRSTSSTTDIDTFDDVTGTDDNLALAVSGAGKDTGDAVVDSTSGASTIETMSVAATGENFVDVSAFTAITGLTVTGTGTLTAVVDVTALETVDASGNSGGLTVDLSAAAADLTVTGGSGDDDITAGTADDTIEAGAGDDRIAFLTGTLNSNDTVTGGDGEDTLALDDGDDAAGLDATEQTEFEVLELGTAAAAVTFDNADFEFTKIVLAGDVTAGGDLTIDNLGDGTVEVTADQTTNGVVVSSSGTSDTLAILINADAAVAINSLDVTDVETVNVSTTADTDDTTFTAIETDGVTALSFTGAGDIFITDITDADNTNDATTKITEIDLTGQTGGFEMTANNLGYGAKFILSNLGNTATANFDFDDDATNDEASELIATTGFRDTFEFSTAFDGNVSIADGEFGGDVTDDRIDLSFFGIASIDDLTFTDGGDGVLITSDAFDGQILLVGLVGADVNSSDFILS